jgi:hypothetical protein
MPRGGSTWPPEEYAAHQILAEFLEAAARCPLFSLGTALLSKEKPARGRAKARRRGSRRRWIREQGLLDPARLVFIDETAVTTNMAPPNGRSPREERLFGNVPTGHRQTLTVIAGFRTTGIVAPMLIKGALNAGSIPCLYRTMSRRYSPAGGYRRRRLRLLPEGRQAGRSQSRAAGQTCDSCRSIRRTSPIASVFHPLKTRLRKAAKRTVNGLRRCVGSFIRGLKPCRRVAIFNAGHGYDRDVLVVRAPLQRDGARA